MSGGKLEGFTKPHRVGGEQAHQHDKHGAAEKREKEGDEGQDPYGREDDRRIGNRGGPAAQSQKSSEFDARKPVRQRSLDRIAALRAVGRDGLRTQVVAAHHAG